MSTRSSARLSRASAAVTTSPCPKDRAVANRPNRHKRARADVSSNSDSSSSTESDSDPEPRHRRIVKRQTKKLATASLSDEPEIDGEIRTATDLLRLFKSFFRTSSDNIILVGRESQKSDIQKFLAKYPGAGKSGGCMYISGAPGTGKTAFVTSLVKQLSDESSGHIEYVELNCMLIGTNPKAIFQLIFERLTGKQTVVKDSVKACEDEIVRAGSKVHLLLILDEIDQLTTKEQDVLYRIFEWPYLKNSRLSLVGIANALDLTDRLLPRLKHKKINPEILSFPAYTAADISAIVKSRLEIVRQKLPAKLMENEDFVFMQNAAIELCSKKVAAYGDFRKALDVCRYAFELVEKEMKSSGTDSIDIASPDFICPKVTVKHVLKVLDLSFGAGNPAVAKILALTPHQKTLVVVIALLEREKLNPASVVESTILRIFETYSSICRRMKTIKEVSRSEFNDIITALESVGLISIMKNSNSKSAAPRNRTPLKALKNSASNSPRTPKSVNSPSSSKLFGSPAQTKGYMLDPSNQVSLNCNDQEIEAGVKEIPFVAELFEDDLPEWAFQLYHSRNDNF